MILCSPAEPAHLISLVGAMKDSDCELIWGADFMWATPYGIAVIQRKRFPSDFLASLRGDDRFAKEVKQFQDQFDYSAWRYLILEIDPELNGKVMWSTTGQLITPSSFRSKSSWSVSQSEIFGLIESLDHFYKIKTRWTRDSSETADLIKTLYKWTSKDSHSGYIPKRQTPSRLSESEIAGDWREFVLTGLPGIGSTLAKRILEAEPLAISWKEGFSLESVPGISKNKAKQLQIALSPKQKKEQKNDESSKA